MREEFLQEKRVSNTVEKAERSKKKSMSGAANIPNSAMLSLYGVGTATEQNPRSTQDLQEKILSRYSTTIRPQAQIPQAENEADRLSSQVNASTPEAVKAEMGQKLSADFSSVRFHFDDRAAAMADLMGARAFTSGQDVYFGSEGFHASTAAHELVHTVQQGVVPGAGVEISTPLGGVQMEEDPSKKKGGTFSRFKRHFFATSRATKEVDEEMRQRDEAFKSQEKNETARQKWEELNMEADPRLEEMTTQLTPLFEHMLAHKGAYAQHGYSPLQQERISQFNSNLKNTKLASHKVNQKKRQLADYQKILAEASSRPDKTSREKVRIISERIAQLTQEIAGIEQNIREMFAPRETDKAKIAASVQEKRPELQGSALDKVVERMAKNAPADQDIIDNFARMYHDPSLPADAILDTSTSTRFRPEALSGLSVTSNSVGKGYGRAAIMGRDYRPTMEFGQSFNPVASLPVKPIPRPRAPAKPAHPVSTSTSAPQSVQKTGQTSSTQPIGQHSPAPPSSPAAQTAPPQRAAASPSPQAAAPQPDTASPSQQTAAVQQSTAKTAQKEKKSKREWLKFWKWPQRFHREDEEEELEFTGPTMSEEARKRFEEETQSGIASQKMVAAASGTSEDVYVDPTNVVHYGIGEDIEGSRTKHLTQTKSLMEQAGEEESQYHTTVDDLNRTIGIVPDMFENMGIFRNQLEEKLSPPQETPSTPAQKEAVAWRMWLSESSRKNALQMPEMNTAQFLVDQRLDEATDERKDASAYEQRSMDSDNLSHQIDSGQIDPETGEHIMWTQEAHKANQQRMLNPQYVYWTPELRQAADSLINAPSLGEKNASEGNIKKASVGAALKAKNEGKDVKNATQTGHQWAEKILNNFLRWMSVVQGRFWRLTSLMGLDFFASRKKQVLFTRADPNAPDFVGSAERRRRLITDSEWRHVREMGYEKTGAVKRLNVGDKLKDKRKVSKGNPS